MGFAVQHFPRYVNTQLTPHAVDVVLMSVILRGRGKHIMADTTHVERSGSVGVTHYGQVHDILTTRRGMEIYNVYLDLRSHTLPVLPEPLQSVIPAILPLHPRFGNRLNRSVHFAVRHPERLGELLARIERELSERSAGYAEAALLAFRLFLIECCREALHSGVSLATPQEPFPDWAERLRQRLDTHFTAKLALDELAADARVSKGHLCRVFRAYSGRTVFQYLIERRVQAAMMRLSGTRAKILGVALDCGFNDIAYFNRVFRRITGRSPGEYRRESEARDTALGR